jgi:hypothetical protein
MTPVAQMKHTSRGSFQTFAIQMKKIITSLMTFLPILAFSQEPESFVYEPPFWEKTWWVIRDFIAWPTLCLIIIAVAALVLMIPVKKRIKNFKLVYALIVIFLFSAWYFYPCVCFKGSYVSYRQYINGEDSSTIVIADNFEWDDSISASYHVNPIQRMLWVETPYLFEKELPVKLRWNKIIVPVFKMGWVEFEKQKNGEPANGESTR